MSSDCVWDLAEHHDCVVITPLDFWRFFLDRYSKEFRAFVLSLRYNGQGLLSLSCLSVSQSVSGL
jgi:hypothetical protein